MREHAPFHSLTLNRSSSMLKKQLSICKSVSLSFLSNEHELVCSKAQMGTSQGQFNSRGSVTITTDNSSDFWKALK